MISRVREAFEKDTEHKIKVAVLDHIMSGLSTILPLPELIELCHKYNVQVPWPRPFKWSLKCPLYRPLWMGHTASVRYH